VAGVRPGLIVMSTAVMSTARGRLSHGLLPSALAGRRLAAYRFQVPPTMATCRAVVCWWKPSASATTGAGTSTTSGSAVLPLTRTR
jgi:hypothetical protein